MTIVQWNNVVTVQKKYFIATVEWNLIGVKQTYKNNIATMVMVNSYNKICANLTILLPRNKNSP